ncbi:unnamed protein product [Parnassius mnemosyne]|uniref:ascorbate ferrireductase (transmembrane) n=1 Tax=Parnassius mnemosyne TaxID=213953 RepID=A0AAV1KID2_9NEOP
MEIVEGFQDSVDNDKNNLNREFVGKFQLLVPSGIFSFSYYNGSTIPMSEKEKKFEHIFLETVGILCCILGSTAIILETEFRLKTTVHAITGVIASCLILLSVFTGTCTNGHGVSKRIMKCIHVVTGVFGFLASSLCFVLGLFRPSVEKWVPVSSVIPFLVIFCILYTTAVVLSPLKNCMKG